MVDEDLLDTPRDILFYKDNQDAPEGTIEMVPGTYAVYFPWDVHIPAIQTGDVPAAIRKIVIKVPMDACLGTGTVSYTHLRALSVQRKTTLHTVPAKVR